MITERVNQYMGAFLILSGLMIGVFAALDGLLFYVFFEATLIPMYLIIGVWGGPRRVYAAFKFFLYTLAGSLLMLVALIYLYYKSGGSFDILAWHALPLALTAQGCCSSPSSSPSRSRCRCGRCTPGCPTPTSRRRPAARCAGGDHAEARRLRLPALLAADRARREPQWAWLMIALSLVAVVYIGLVALVQQDMKKLVAYSSIAHMGFVTLGFFLFDEARHGRAASCRWSRTASSRARCSCASACSTTASTRARSRPTAASPTRCRSSPRFAVLFAMANCGLPGTAGFVGEWMVILGAVKVNFWIGLDRRHRP